MKVSVIIPVYNEEEYIEECLKSVLNQTQPADEIIVIDNNSTDKTPEILKKFPQVRVINEKKQGMIPARNKGFDSAKGDIIARTDADTRVPRNWIKRIKKHFEDKDLMALSGPAQFYGLISNVEKLPMTVYFRTFKQVLHHDCLFGPNISLRKSMWGKIKKEVCLDDHEVHEDVDLAIHIAKYGKVLFDYKLIVSSSPRRWKKLTPYLEYPYRYLKTIQKHREAVLSLKNGRRLVNSVVPRTKHLLKRMSASLTS